MESEPAQTVAGSAIPTLDLNELLLEHPAASFVFSCDGNLLIVDRAGTPHEGSLVLIKTSHGYLVALYTGQETWGVVTYQLHKTT